VHADAGAERILGDHGLHFLHGAAQIDVAQVGRDDGHAHLVGAMDLAGTGGGHDIRHRRQRHRAGTAGI